jgi:hypothetical protein
LVVSKQHAELAGGARAMAARCRALAYGMMPGPDRDRLLSLARSLEEEAEDAADLFMTQAANSDRCEAAE